jgi:opacity protein-like surface antigen
MKKLLILSMLLLIGQHTFADKVRNISSQQHGWYMYFGTHRITSKWSVHTEYQWRRANWITDWQQSLLRLGVDYRLKENLIFTAGYGLIHTFPYGEFPVLATFHEHRSWQQMATTQAIGRVTLGHRYRLEQRWKQNVHAIENGAIEKNGYNYTNRFRYMFSLILPINKPNIEERTLFFRFYDEAFVNFGEQVQLNLFDQNRLFGAFGYQFSKNGNVQMGYLNQLLVSSNGKSIENNHTLQLACVYNLDFRKKETQP